MPLFLQCHRGNAQSRDLENKHPVLLCTGVHVAPVTPLNSPRGHPWRDALPRQPTNDDTTKKGYQAGQHIPGAFFGGELCESDETFGGCGRESDELAGLDDRARTLLEYCRDLLTPPPTTFDQVRGVGNLYSGTAQYLCSVSSRILQETSPLGENSWRQLEDSHQVGRKWERSAAQKSLTTQTFASRTFLLFVFFPYFQSAPCDVSVLLDLILRNGYPSFSYFGVLVGGP